MDHLYLMGLSIIQYFEISPHDLRLILLRDSDDFPLWISMNSQSTIIGCFLDLPAVNFLDGPPISSIISTLTTVSLQWNHHHYRNEESYSKKRKREGKGREQELYSEMMILSWGWNNCIWKPRERERRRQMKWKRRNERLKGMNDPK